MMAPKVLRLRSSSQMREVNTHGAAGGRAWLNPSVCVRTIGTRCRREVNRQGSEVEIWRVTPGYGRDADRQTDRQICIYQNRDSVLQIENNYCYCPRWNAFERCSQFVLSSFFVMLQPVSSFTAKPNLLQSTRRPKICSANRYTPSLLSLSTHLSP